MESNFAIMLWERVRGRDQEQSKKYYSKALAIFKFLLRKDPSDTNLRNEINNIDYELSYQQKALEARGKIYDTNVI